MNGFNKMIVIFLSVFLLYPASASGEEQHKSPIEEQRPLKVMTASEWAGLSEKEQGLLIAGVLEGWSFDLFNQNHPHLKVLVDCVENEGIGKFVDAVNTLIIAEPDEGKFPSPWWISKSFGAICQKYKQ